MIVGSVPTGATGQRVADAIAALQIAAFGDQRQRPAIALLDENTPARCRSSGVAGNDGWRRHHRPARLHPSKQMPGSNGAVINLPDGTCGFGGGCTSAGNSRTAGENRPDRKISVNCARNRPAE